MLKVLIVDDEGFIRRGLSAIIQESGLGFEVTGEAANGFEALELMEVECPDVVITDIKMPKMDGIELIKNVEHKYPDIKKIVLSGFDEFNFVRETMKRGALDYLLKPVNEIQMIELLKRIETDIKLENEKKLNSINLNLKLNESMPLLRDKFLKEFICEDNYSSRIEIEKKIKSFNININTGDFFIIVVSMDNYNYLSEKLAVEELKINDFIVRNIALESLEVFAECLSFRDDNGLVIVCSTNGRPYKEIVFDISQGIYRNLVNHTEIRFTLTTGMPVNDFFKLNESYLSAIKVLEYRFFRESSSIIKYDDPKQNYNKYPDGFTDSVEKDLNKYIESSDINGIKSVMNNFCMKLKELFIIPGEAVKAFADIYMRLQVDNIKFKEAVAETFGFNYSYIKKLDLFDTLDEVRNYTLSAYTEIIKKMIMISGKKDKRIIQHVKEYIDLHYNEDINLNMMADIVYINPNYLSDLFKSQTGENFVDYFTKIRIERAKSLLKDIKIKTYEVGELVGYEDPAYFSKVFKKNVGVSPSEYRNIIK